MVGLVKYARLCRADDGFPPLHASTIFDLIFTCCCIGSYVLCGLALPRVSLSVTYASRLGPALRKGGGSLTYAAAATPRNVLPGLLVLRTTTTTYARALEVSVSIPSGCAGERASIKFKGTFVCNTRGSAVRERGSGGQTFLVACHAMQCRHF